MSSNTQQIVNRAWNYAHRPVTTPFLHGLRRAGRVSALPENGRRAGPAALQPQQYIPARFGWPSLLKLDGAELETHYHTVLEESGPPQAADHGPSRYRKVDADGGEHEGGYR